MFTHLKHAHAGQGGMPERYLGRGFIEEVAVGTYETHRVCICVCLCMRAASHVCGYT